MESPLFLASVVVGEIEQFGKLHKTVFHKFLWRPANVGPHFFGNLMKMVQFVANHAHQIPH